MAEKFDAPPEELAQEVRELLSRPLPPRTDTPPCPIDGTLGHFVEYRTAANGYTYAVYECAWGHRFNRP